MLEHFFGSKTRVRLLKIFIKSPGKAYFVRELSRLIGTQLNAVRREIAHLEKLHFIEPVGSEQVPAGESGTERSKYYQLNTDYLLYPELRALLAKADLLEEKELIEQLQGKGGRLDLFMLTGQFTSALDVSTDLLLVGRLKPLVIARLIKQYELELGKTIRYTLLSTTEFMDRREIGDKFLYSIFEAKHYVVVNEILSTI